MLIYLIRHGQSEGNMAKLYQHPETELSETGKGQVKLLAKRLSKTPIDFIYTSSLKRAMETAKIISKSKKLKIETWDDIKEIRRPTTLRGKHLGSQEAELFNKAYNKNYKDPEWKYSDEENYNELTSRAKKVLEHLKISHINQNVILVSHGTFIKTLTAVVLFRDALTPEIFWNFRHHSVAKNTGITTLEYTNEYGWSLISWNDMTHIK